MSTMRLRSDTSSIRRPAAGPAWQLRILFVVLSLWTLATLSPFLLSPGLAAPPLGEEEVVLEITTIDHLLARQQWEEAAKRARRLLENSTGSYYNWQIQERLGLALYGAGQAGEAIPHFEAAVRAAPHEPSPHLNLATALMAMGKRGRAFAEYQEAVDLDPDSWRAHLDFGQALLEFGMLEEAGRHLQGAAQGCSDCLEVDRALARWHLLAGDNDAAIPLLEKLYNAEPTATVRQNLATAYKDTGRHQALYRLLLPLWPHDLSSPEHGMVLEIDRAEGRSVRACEMARDLRAGEPIQGSAVFWGLVSLICLEADHLEDALTAADQAIAIDPRNATYRNNRVVVLTRLGRQAEAEQEWQRVLELAPELRDEGN